MIYFAEGFIGINNRASHLIHRVLTLAELMGGDKIDLRVAPEVLLDLKFISRDSLSRTTLDALKVTNEEALLATEKQTITLKADVNLCNHAIVLANPGPYPEKSSKKKK